MLRRSGAAAHCEAVARRGDRPWRWRARRVRVPGHRRRRRHERRRHETTRPLRDPTLARGSDRATTCAAVAATEVEATRGARGAAPQATHAAPRSFAAVRRFALAGVSGATRRDDARCGGAQPRGGARHGNASRAGQRRRSPPSCKSQRAVSPPPPRSPRRWTTMTTRASGEARATRRRPRRRRRGRRHPRRARRRLLTRVRHASSVSTRTQPAGAPRGAPPTRTRHRPPPPAAVDGGGAALSSRRRRRAGRRPRSGRYAHRLPRCPPAKQRAADRALARGRRRGCRGDAATVGDAGGGGWTRSGAAAGGGGGARGRGEVRRRTVRGGASERSPLASGGARALDADARSDRHSPRSVGDGARRRGASGRMAERGGGGGGGEFSTKKAKAAPEESPVAPEGLRPQNPGPRPTRTDGFPPRARLVQGQAQEAGGGARRAGRRQHERG